MVYAVKDESEVVFKNELDSLKDNKQVHYYHFSNNSGRLSEEHLKKLITSFNDTDFFVCGPDGMMTFVVKILKGMDIPEKKIHFEKFSY